MIEVVYVHFGAGVFLLAYLVPIVFFVYMGTDVLLRNPKKAEHRIVCVTAACYVLLMTEEYVRHQLPIGSSAAMSALWFSNVGIAIPGLGFHFLAKFSGMDKKMSRYLYPWLFYLPLSVIFVNLSSSEKVISFSQFVQTGIRKLPVYNLQYYIALRIFNMNPTATLLIERTGLVKEAN